MIHYNNPKGTQSSLKSLSPDLSPNEVSGKKICISRFGPDTTTILTNAAYNSTSNRGTISMKNLFTGNDVYQGFSVPNIKMSTISHNLSGSKVLQKQSPDQQRKKLIMKNDVSKRPSNSPVESKIASKSRMQNCSPESQVLSDQEKRTRDKEAGISKEKEDDLIECRNSLTLTHGNVKEKKRNSRKDTKSRDEWHRESTGGKDTRKKSTELKEKKKKKRKRIHEGATEQKCATNTQKEKVMRSTNTPETGKADMKELLTTTDPLTGSNKCDKSEIKCKVVSIGESSPSLDPESRHTTPGLTSTPTKSIPTGVAVSPVSPERQDSKDLDHKSTMSHQCGKRNDPASSIAKYFSRKERSAKEKGVAKNRLKSDKCQEHRRKNDSMVENETHVEMQRSGQDVPEADEYMAPNSVHLNKNDPGCSLESKLVSFHSHIMSLLPSNHSDILLPAEFFF